MTLTNRILGRMLKGTSAFWPDKTYLKMLFRIYMGNLLDLNNPQTFNEKLQWLKIHNRHDDMTVMVDKISVKDYVASRIGTEYIIPTLKIWERPEEIDFSELPNKFVVKTNHSGGNTGVVVVTDKSSADLETIKRRMSKSLKSDIYKNLREWPYEGVQKRIFAEELIGQDPVDYKFYCFDGKADCVMVCLGRGEGKTKFYFFDSDWNLKRINKAGKEAPEGFTLPKPEGMDKMFELAGELSKGMPFARVDLYNQQGKIYFGEITFFPASGLDPNYLPETDRYFGDLINLNLATVK